MQLAMTAMGAVAPVVSQGSLANKLFRPRLAWDTTIAEGRPQHQPCL